MYIYVYVYVYIHTYTYVYTYMYACMYIRMHACMHACIHECRQHICYTILTIHQQFKKNYLMNASLSVCYIYIDHYIVNYIPTLHLS